MGSRGEGRAKEKKTDFFLFLKIYENELDSKAIQRLFPGNGARRQYRNRHSSFGTLLHLPILSIKHLSKRT